MIEALIAAFLALFVGLQIAVPFKVRGVARIAAFLPLTALLVVSGFLYFSFRHAEGGWAGFPAFLFLLVGIPAATIALALIWAVYHFDYAKRAQNGHRPNH